MKKYTSRQEIANAYSRGEISQKEMAEKINELNTFVNNSYEKLKNQNQYKKQKEIKH